MSEEQSAEVSQLRTETVKPPVIDPIDVLAMSICKLAYAVTLQPGTKERKEALAKAVALAEPYTPQLEDNHDDETAA